MRRLFATSITCSECNQGTDQAALEMRYSLRGGIHRALSPAMAVGSRPLMSQLRRWGRNGSHGIHWMRTRCVSARWILSITDKKVPPISTRSVPRLFSALLIPVCSFFPADLLRAVISPVLLFFLFSPLYHFFLQPQFPTPHFSRAFESLNETAIPSRGTRNRSYGECISV